MRLSMRRSTEDKIEVRYHSRLVGFLTDGPSDHFSFAYDETWLHDGFSISPFSLPLNKGTFVPKKDVFGGLFGVFADSLPDSWGTFVTNQYLISKGLDPQKISVFTRLSLLGNDSLGGLEYGPKDHSVPFHDIKLDEAHAECEKLVEERNDLSLDEMMSLSGSSGGAHPKVHINIDDEDFIVKFPGPHEPLSVGKMEFDYNDTARALGIEVPPYELFPSKNGPGFFASKRFDRFLGKRIHVISLAALYEVGLFEGLLDYGNLLSATLKLTRDEEEGWKAFRLMCFNIYAHNTDNHAKNFSFMYDEGKGHYVLAPAYDLTNPHLGKGHSLLVNHSYNPTDDDILALAKVFDFGPLSKVLDIMETTKKVVKERLGQYL